MRGENEVTSTSIFGVCERDDTQRSKTIDESEDIIKLAKSGDSYYVKAKVGAGDGHKLSITNLVINIIYKKRDQIGFN